MSDFTELVLDHCATGAEALVPAVWPFEVANALITARRSGRVPEERVSQFLAQLFRFRIAIDTSSIKHTLLEVRGLASLHGLTSYDASYLELAIRRGLPLATPDNDLRTAAGVANVALLGGP